MDLALAVPPSALGFPSLETIPGSVDQTPALNQEDEAQSPKALEQESIEMLENSEDVGDSRRLSLGLTAIPGSYFPSSITSTSYFPPSNTTLQANTPSGASTPGRPRPSPISIPVGTPDEPLFSAYPDTGALPGSISKGKGKERVFSIAPTFSLSRPPSRRKNKMYSDRDDPSPQESPSTDGSSSPDLATGKPKGRRRAFSASHVYTTPAAIVTPPQRHRSHRSVKRLIPHSRTFGGFHARRPSMDSVTAEISQAVDKVTDWRSMEAQVSERFETRPSLPFSYDDPNYTLQSVSTFTATRPLGSPPITTRRSSLAVAASESDVHAQTSSILLGLSNVAHSTSTITPSEILQPMTDEIPHQPPPRRSSLGGQPVELPAVDDRQHDHQSVLSGSATATETTASVGAFSPSNTDHPLSSATTSLSRSAKSGKEGDDGKESQLSAVRLQRSLEWEAKQDKQRRRIEKRKMIILELVETEVSYVEDLKILVHVYLPQLAALGLPENTVGLVARNTADLLFFHTQFASRMVDVLREEGLGLDRSTAYSQEGSSLSETVERVSRRIAALFIEDCSGFAAYNDFCAGSIAAATLIRNISQRADYDAFERRCQIISSSQSGLTLRDLLSDEPPPIASASNRSRLRFKDFLIMPIQRVCRYPMLLASLVGSAPTPSDENISYSPSGTVDDKVGVDVERALSTMRAVAEEADEARRLKETEIKSATLLERMELHPILTPPFLRSLGTCRLIGALDVLHHHPTLHPLVPPVKVKYLAAFLFRGYLILAKVKKGKVYEAKHFLPLEVFELIDITEGFLPHSIRLTLREHNFDLAASCDSEKEVWAAAVCDARDESTVPPFELPASVSPFAARTRRVSTFGLSTSSSSNGTSLHDMVPTSPSRKRHTLAGMADGDTALDLEAFGQSGNTFPPSQSPFISASPSTTSRPKPNTILLRRASASQRLLVDRGLVDVFSESCATARSKAQLHHTLFLPDSNTGLDMRNRLSMRESTVLRRRRSFLDSRSTSGDIVSTGEFRGNVMPLRQTRSSIGAKRSATVAPAGRARSDSLGGNGSATEIDGKDDGGDDTVVEVSDFGSLVDRQPSRTGSLASVSSTSGSMRERIFPYPPLFPGAPVGRLVRGNSNNERPLSTVRDVRSPNERLRDSKRKTASAHNLNNSRPSTPSRARSMPVSPVATPDFDLHPASLTADSRARTGYFPSIPSESVTPSASSTNVYALGSGFTNQSQTNFERNRPSSNTSSPWQTLKRNLSILPKSRNSVISLQESMGDPQSPTSRHESLDDKLASPARTHRDLPKADVGAKGSSSSAQSEAAAVDEDEGVVLAPRRRRSMKMFTGLRFTPI